MVVCPLVGMTGDGVATSELRRTHQSTCARVQNGAQQVLVEGTRRVVPIGTSSSSFLQSARSRLESHLPLLSVPFLAVRTSAGRKGMSARRRQSHHFRSLHERFSGRNPHWF